jgi:D-glycero-D-manno-heptose 1,7-bisphosphate phosphatase
MLPVVVLAGGLGTRLGEIGTRVPKIMMPIGKQIFLDLQLKLFVDNGVRDLTYCLGHLGQQVEEHVQHISIPNEMIIKFSYDGDKQLGTGGAILKAVKNYEGKFLVVYGDSYLQVKYEEISGRFQNSKQSCIMTVLHNKDLYDKSNVSISNGMVSRYHKDKSDSDLDFIDFGILGFSTSVFSHFEAYKSFDLSLVIQHAIQSNNVLAFEVQKRFFEIGSQQGILDLERYLYRESANELRN